MHKRDEKLDLLRRLRKSEPSIALKLAIRQTTQQLNGNQEILLPLKDHSGILGRFDQNRNQWKTSRTGLSLQLLKYSATVSPQASTFFEYQSSDRH